MDSRFCPNGGEHDIKWLCDTELGERFVCWKGCGAYWRHATLPRWYRVQHALEILETALKFDGSDMPEMEAVDRWLI